MSTRTTTPDRVTDHNSHGSRSASIADDSRRRLSTETKAAFKTTEFFAFLAVLAGLLIAGAVVDNGEGGFGPQEVWRYATILTVGYMVSRGLAKAGSRDPYDESR